MADNGDLNYQVGADVSQATAELQKLKSQINGTTANLQQTQATIEASLKRMTADIERSMSKAKAGSDQLLASMRRLDRVQGNTLSSAARGSMSGQTLGAAGQLLSSEARNSAEAVTARITNEIIGQFTQKLRTAERTVDARIRQAMASNDRFLANSTPEAMQTRNTLANRSAANNQRRAELGDARYGMANAIERVSSNGGADMVTLQTKVLAGYAALNLAMNGLQNAAQFVVGLDAEFRQFQAITATTNFEMMGLKDSLIEVSQASKFTALEIAEAATVMGQAGFSAKEVGETVGSVAALATAAGSTLAESVDVVTSTMAIFNLQTSQAADVANTLTSALNLSKLSMDKLVLGFQYAGNTAAQMGITYQELTGVLGALANSGIRSGSTLGTGLRQLLIDIQNPSKKLTETLKDLGLTQEDVNIESNGLVNVLQSLKEAGFGSAQAFETMEVRAAAAYAALSNNTDLAVELQQQFILSSAAVEANAVQMESLANTYAKFQSVIGTVAYTAFEPLIAALQKALNGFADMLSVLNQFPGLLQVLAVAFAGLGTAIVLSSASALFRGLLGAIPIFNSLTVATAGTTTAMGALNMVMRANPFILVASLAAAAVVGFNAFGTSALTAADKIDILKGQVNTFKGQIGEADSQIEAINQTISNLIRQKTALDADPLMRSAKIMEVKQAFKEISTEVDTTTGTVEELIEALTRLANTDFSKLGESIRSTVAANEALIAGQEALLAENAAKAPQTMYNQLGNYRAVDPNFSKENVFAGPDEYNANIVKLFERTFDGMDERIAEIAAIALDPSKMPKDVNEAQSLTYALDTNISRLTAQQTQLQGQKNLGVQLTKGEVDILNRLPIMIDMLTTVKAGIAPMVGNLTSIASTEQDNRILRNDQLQADAGSLTSAPNGVAEDLNVLETQISERLREIRREGATQSVEEQLAAYAQLDKDFQAGIDAITADTEALAQQLVADPKTDYTIEEARSAMANVTDRVASMKAQVSTAAKDKNLAVQKLNEENSKVELEDIDDAIKLQLDKGSRALTLATIDQLKTYVSGQFDKKAAIIEELYGAQMAQAENDDDRAAVARDLRQAQRQLQAEEAEAMRSLADDRGDLQADIIQDQKDVIDEQVKVMQGKLDMLVSKINAASPGPIMDALMLEWQKVADAQNALLGQSNSMGVQIGTLTASARPLNGTQATRGNDAMEIMMSLGYSKAQAAGIVGNLMAESNVNPNAVGDRGQAYGIGQWHPDRQRLLKQYADDNGRDYQETETQLRFIDWEMKNSKSTAGANTYEQLMAQTTAEGAADTFRRLYERPSADPKLGAHEARIGYAKTLADQPYAAQVANDNQNQTKYDDAVDNANVRGVTNATNASIKTANQQIQTLTTQANIASNPETIKGMIESVNGLYGTIIEESKKQFDEENKASIAAGDEAVAAQRDAMIEGIKADQNQKMSSMLETYWKALDEKIQEPLEDAKRALDEAQKPENAAKYTQADILGLENNVRIAEQKVLVDQLSAAQNILAEAQARVASTAPGSADNNYWLLEEARALEIVNGLTKEKNAADSATAQQSPSVTSAINSATQAWAMQNGVLDETGKMIPLAKQVENSWGQVLDTLTTGFSTLFTDLAKGTMTAGEAFSKFALSVIDGFMQMIAKALAMQVVMQLMESTGGETGWLGTIIGGLTGVAAPAANGDYIRGAAVGEVVPGISNRDSVLRKVMPGEMILRRSAVSAIGQGALENINNMGSTMMSDGEAPMMPANENQGGGGSVNVWVVSPDQVPQMGPNDVIATIADNIQRRGSIKTLIQQVNMGAM